MGIKVIKGIVVERYEYRDFDLIVTIVTTLGRIKFVAPGVRKVGSKNIFGLNQGSLSEFELFLAQNTERLSKLKRAESIKNLDFTDKIVLDFWKLISQITRKDEFVVELFESIQKAFLIINWQNAAAIKVFIILNWLKKNGLIANLSACRVCKTNQRLTNFDFYGGMECFFHFKKKPSPHFNSQELAIFYWSDYEFDNFLKKIDFNYAHSVFVVLKEFLKQNSYIYL
ncbi:DNA repair protein RecO [Mycoplasma sp. 'Moose RK']|uniref:DNA repair protein RecO n=1 Tax=Mycoplasma sp. 'Moose RK' TaxID=2780095 RepID=UPI0018C332C9|nr:DNA repair protein RecO [Mycoplasma sp. 'Moose RK']MBG0730954.1 DNA repair protein RecO [Mycoplasma sp. 'Moose RK']